MTNRTQSCSVSEIELLRYEDGDLPAERQSVIAAHVVGCSRCQERLAASATIGRLLRRSLPPIDDPAGEAQLLARLRQREQLPRRHPLTQGLMAKPTVIALGLLVVVLAGITFQETTTADFRLGRVIAFVTRSEPATQPEGQPPAGQPLTTMDVSTTTATDITPVVPRRLPLGLELVERLDGAQSRVVAQYAAATSLQIRIGQEHVRPDRTSIGTERTERIVVQQTEVIVERNTLGDIVRAIWEREDVLFDLVVLQSGTQPLTIDDVTAIVAALITAQRTQS